ncbi:DUF7302 family protein [Lysinibacillus sp. NPDC093712]
MKNLKTGITWAVTDEHGTRLLRSGEFEETQAEKPKRATSKKTEVETEK